MRGRRTLLGKREQKSGEADRVSATSRAARRSPAHPRGAGRQGGREEPLRGTNSGALGSCFSW